MATAVAARTRTLRVGTSVILLPLYHPVRVAEDAITLDLVSKGRLVLGVGIGYQPADFRAYGIPMEHRVPLFEESVEILRRCFAGEPFSFHGKHYTLEDVQTGRARTRNRARRSGSAAAWPRRCGERAGSPTPSWERPAPASPMPCVWSRATERRPGRRDGSRR